MWITDYVQHQQEQPLEYFKEEYELTVSYKYSVNVIQIHNVKCRLVTELEGFHQAYVQATYEYETTWKYISLEFFWFLIQIWPIVSYFIIMKIQSHV